MNFNPFDLLKNANNLQAQFQKTQEELKETFATGSSGGGIVKVTINGAFEIVDVQIDPIAVDPRDVKMLQDLIVAAAHDANERIKDGMKDKIGSLNIPGLNL
ncbi:MAG: YbaB/EbfC family nucleoid-associated protein [Treponemataceae bacterium]|jgi:DNA-binding YbaB/EbfC family protein|nr:YbaB/EbfC family nucleoid-associated protein [Treponemataceae bacterium]